VTTPVFPPGRYGRRRERPAARRWVVPALASLALAVALGLAVVAYRNQNSGVQASVTGFSIDPASVRVTFEVSRPADQAVRCLLRARDVRGAEVGRARVPIAAGPSRVIVTYTLTTHGRANTGEVYGCSAQAG